MKQIRPTTYRRHNSRSRRGFAAVIALLFMMLFAVMSLGLYAAGTRTTEISYNDASGMRALTAAENGMQFIRFQLDNLDIPYTSAPDANTMFNTVVTQLHTKLDGTTNMRDSTGTLYNPTTGTDVSGNNVLYIPGKTSGTQHWMNLDSSSSCYITITQSGTNLVVKAVGNYGNAVANPARAVQLTYNPAENAADIFNYGVATKSPVSMQGNVAITGTPGHLDNGSVLSATGGAHPLSMTGNPSISGNFAYTNANGTNSFGNGTIAGETASNSDFHNHVTQLGQAPDFPAIDTTVFKQSVTTWNNPPASGSVYTNVKLPAGNYNFNNITINGILYIMQPSTVRFGGNVVVNGSIVVDNTNVGTYTSNTLNFAGNVTTNAMSTITDPTILAQITPAEKALTGAFVLAPNFSLTFGGNTHSETFNGTIVGDQMSFNGNTAITVLGTVINMKDTAVSLSGNDVVTIASQGTTNYPAGVYFGSHYKPASDTYAEVHP
jgi:hypothetical protein